MPEGTDDVVVRLRAQVDQLQGDLAKAQQTIQGFAEQTTSSFAAIGEALAGAFAAEKILGFIKDGIAAFAEYERSLDNLGKKVSATGANWDELRGAVVEYTKGIGETTRFSQDQAVKALDGLMLRTNDYTTALKLNERAMNLAVLANIPLTEAANELGLAYQGNQRGLLMLGRQLGLTRGEAHNAQAVFDLLDKRSQGLARSEEDLATSLDKAQHSIAETGKAIGEALSPAVSYLAKLLSEILGAAVTYTIKAFQSLGVEVGYVMLTVTNYIEKWKGDIMALAEFLLHVWRHPIDAWNEMHKEMAKTNKEFVASQNAADTALSEESVKIWGKTAKAKNEIDVKALNDHLVVKKKEEVATITMAKSELDYFKQQQDKKTSIFSIFERGVSNVHAAYNETRAKDDKEYAAQFKEDQKQLEESAKEAFASIKQFGQEMATTLSKVGETWVKEWKAGTLTVLGAFKELATGILSAMLQAIGKALIEEGAKYAAMATAALLGIITAPGAPGLFAAAAELSAAGGVVMGIASSVKLAEGGIVTKPTRALIGEDGPEAVIPLGKGGAAGMMGDTVFKDTAMVFPGVRNAHDLEGARFQQTAERVLATTWQRMNQRKGIKVPA